MIGYSPFLGQVRIARSFRRVMGQAQFMGRIEGRDAETGSYIQGARVSVVHPGGIALSKVTDIGGNAVFTSQELTGKIAQETAKGDVVYRVEMDGYEPQDAPFIGDQITTVNLVKSPIVAPTIPTWGYVAGGVAVVTLIALLASQNN